MALEAAVNRAPANPLGVANSHIVLDDCPTHALRSTQKAHINFVKADEATDASLPKLASGPACKILDLPTCCDFLITTERQPVAVREWALFSRSSAHLALK